MESQLSFQALGPCSVAKFPVHHSGICMRFRMQCVPKIPHIAQHAGLSSDPNTRSLNPDTP